MKVTLEIKPETSATGVNLFVDLDKQGGSIEDLAAFMFLLTTGSLNEKLIAGLSRNINREELGNMAEHWDDLIEQRNDFSEALPLIEACNAKLGL